MRIVPLAGDGLDRFVTTEAPHRYFSQPYPWCEAVRWVANNLWGPSQRYAELTPWLPEGSGIETVERRLTIAFAGDILPLQDRRFRPATELCALLSGVDILVANFEGTVAGARARPVFLAQAHTPAVLEFLAELFPPSRTLLSVANNHAGDFGWRVFEQSCDRLADSGFHVFGRPDRPGLMVDDVAVLSFTEWSNHPCEYVCREEPKVLGKRPRLRILTPHWGYELQAYPHPGQIARARDLLRRWDLVVGHHSHWPQPVTAYDLGGRKRLVAYSLGNFTFGLPYSRHLRGLLLIVDVGPGCDGVWGVGRIRWWWTRTVLRARGAAEVVLEPAAANHGNRARKFVNIRYSGNALASSR